MGREGQTAPTFVIALAVESGHLLWHTPLPGEGFIDSATYDAEHLYLVSDFWVRAIDLNSGQAIWETKKLADRTSYYFRPWDSLTPLHLYTTDKKMILLDPLTGTELGREPAGELLGNDDTEFVTQNIRFWEAKDRENGEILWQKQDEQSPQYHIELWPSFVADDMIFKTQGLRVMRMRVRTGVSIWETEAIYPSNFALLDDKLYLVRNDNALVTLDANTGAVLDEIAIGGPPHDAQRDDWVLAQSPYVLVYFSNTQELIAFKMP